MKVHQSALKHGVSREDAVQAADWSQWIEPIGDDDWPHRELRLGFDTHVRLLENPPHRASKVSTRWKPCAGRVLLGGSDARRLRGAVRRMLSRFRIGAPA